jgi:hypothetical protein
MTLEGEIWYTDHKENQELCLQVLLYVNSNKLIDDRSLWSDNKHRHTTVYIYIYIWSFCTI